MVSATKILKNSFSNGIAFVVEAVTAFVMMPFVIHHIGDEAYGVWVLINAISGYLGLFKLGFRPSINKYVSQYHALNDFVKMREFVAATLQVFIWVALFALLTAAIIAFAMGYWSKMDAQLLEMAKIIVLMAGVQMAIALMGTAYGGIISGYQRYEINAGIEIAVILVRAALIFTLLPYMTSLYTVAITHFSITIIGFLVTIYCSRQIAPVKNLHVFAKPSKEIKDTIIQFNSISFAIGGLSIIVNYADAFVVGAIMSSAAVTHYAVGGQLIKYTFNLMRVTTRVIAPAISELDAQNNVDKIGELLLYVTKLACIVCFAIILCLMVQGDSFIQLWMGDGYQQSYQVLLVLSMAYIFICPQEVVTPLLYGTAKHGLLFRISLVETIVSLPLAILLGNYYGMIGVAIGLVWPRAALRLLFFAYVIKQRLNAKPLMFFVKTYLHIGVISIPYTAALYYFKLIGWCDSGETFVAQLIASLIAYAFFLWFAGFNQLERGFIRAKFASIARRS